MSDKSLRTTLVGEFIRLLGAEGPLRRQDVAHKLGLADDNADLAVHLQAMLNRTLLSKAHGLYHLVDDEEPEPVNGTAVGKGLEGKLAHAVEAAEQALEAYLREDDLVASELFGACASARRALERYRERHALPLFLRRQAD